MGWNSTIPVTGTNIIDIPTLFSGNWYAFEGILGEGHYTFTPATSGRHFAGKTGVLSSGATSAVTAISPIGTDGYVAFDDTIGSLITYLGSTWTYISTFPDTAIKVYHGTGDQSVVASGAKVEFNTQIEDDLGEFDTSTYTFTPCAAGFFLIEPTLSIVAIGGVVVTTSIMQRDSSGNEKNNISSSYMCGDSNRVSVRNVAILEGAADDQFYIYFSHDRPTSVVVEAGDERSFLTIKRLS